ncbi:MAG: dicarboxylate/amino acid:cation symporter [Fusobacterium sp.]|jgi:Na+/H+-dicarboxylate symporter|uniref:dicarboxylate/amino acid:cation symporter n=1 Tax=Fusobacterium sp. TaxID=68766 RepID=UPI0015A64F15|nr:dicarboxylate/amino acid:cation symporter [Fusobacterium sp.]MCF2639866.1 dicarboxylate/amino acid:cation symporter [Fusobacterium varium]MDY3059400.1 dicarboxylate/amino acid:cation symporter [Fusobacterium sp.]MEE1475515.1 dicarboxylate/amino acid:cation symporter [Fusobacterium sp.]
MEKQKIKIGLVPKLIIGIILGILIGMYLPEWVGRLIVTASSLFSMFLKFVIPMMILAFVTMGIADLTQGAGKLLGITAAISYASTLIAGSVSFFVANSLFMSFMDPKALERIAKTAGISVAPYLSLSVTPILDTLAAVLLAFILGLCMSTMRGKEIGNTLYDFMKDFSAIINKVLHTIIVPFLPLYICGTFIDMTRSGKTFAILGILWKVFIIVIIMHLLYLVFAFFVAGGISKKNPLMLLKNQIPGYTTAVGTQSSAATIPVNLECAKADGISEEIRNFVVPLCANIHMAGSMITITACATAVCMMNGLPISINTVVPFIATLGIAMVASPGAPGGSIMTALPFLYMVGLGTEELQAIMIALYITQDSFGTACNVSGDNAIGLIVDAIYKKWIKE